MTARAFADIAGHLLDNFLRVYSLAVFFCFHFAEKRSIKLAEMSEHKFKNWHVGTKKNWNREMQSWESGSVHATLRVFGTSYHFSNLSWAGPLAIWGRVAR